MSERCAEITVFTKSGGPLSKHIELIDGKIGNDSSSCRMAKGSARRVRIDLADIASLADLINGFSPKEAYAIGRFKRGLPDRVKVVRADKLDAAKGDPSVIARTKEHLVFGEGEPAFALLDVDHKGMPDDARRRIKETGGVWAVLCAVAPALGAAAYVERASTSAGLRNRETGETYPGSGGFHAAVPVADGADIERFLSDFHDRLWLAGYGWGIGSAAGSFLERSLVDKACGSPERLIFEGPPIIQPPLEQAPRPAVAHPGDILDTKTAASPLSDVEKEELERLKQAERARLKPQLDGARAKWSESHIERLVVAGGMTRTEARAQVDHWIDGQELTGDFPLPFDDPQLAVAAVADVLAAPSKFVGKTLSDPVEGPAYGRGKAVVYQRANGSLFINSFAHGGVRYELREAQRPDIAAAIERLARLPALDYERAREDAAKRLGVRVTSLDKAVEAKRHDDDQPDPAQYARRQVEKAHAADPRPTIELSVGSTERTVDELERLLMASDRRLYQRGGFIVSTGFAKLKTWDQKDAVVQIIEERGDYAMLEDLEAVAQFVVRDEKGGLRTVNPPKKLVFTLKDRKSRLRFPILTAIVNCPSIAANGELFDRPGYDPTTGVFFDPLGVDFGPVPDLPTKPMAELALHRILRLFDTFEFITAADKAVATSGVLTAVARRGLPFAPAHGFDAPVAGAGKSKIVDIISIIATGRRAAVMSQGEPEEFAKALGAVLMRGDPLISIDNCSHPLEGDLLNMAITQEFVEVRILGHSRMVSVQTKALPTFTGNNLQVLGDLTRRCVVGRLDPKRERPELMQFDFDPIAYAMENRPQLVVDVLTILKAYHNAGRPDCPPRLQSFECWSDTVRGALLWLGQGDPVKTMDRLRMSDTAVSDMIAVFTAWRAEFDGERVSADEVIEKAEAHDFVAATNAGPLFPPIQEKRFTNPQLRNALMAVASKNGRLDPSRLKYWLRRVKERVVSLTDPNEPRALVADGEKHRGVVAWKLAQTAEG